MSAAVPRASLPEKARGAVAERREAQRALKTRAAVVDAVARALERGDGGGQPAGRVALEQALVRAKGKR
jgi:hypothetical protein